MSPFSLAGCATLALRDNGNTRELHGIAQARKAMNVVESLGPGQGALGVLQTIIADPVVSTNMARPSPTKCPWMHSSHNRGEIQPSAPLSSLAVTADGAPIPRPEGCRARRCVAECPSHLVLAQSSSGAATGAAPDASLTTPHPATRCAAAGRRRTPAERDRNRKRPDEI